LFPVIQGIKKLMKVFWGVVWLVGDCAGEHARKPSIAVNCLTC
jgi:hypothetical protein